MGCMDDLVLVVKHLRVFVVMAFFELVFDFLSKKSVMMAIIRQEMHVIVLVNEKNRVVYF